MPFGFFTVEQWARKKGKFQWSLVGHLDHCHSLSDAIQFLEKKGEPGFFRVIQTQRMIRAEKENGKLHLRKWHAGTPETLARSAKAFERDGKKRPIPRRKD
jgi:hypothetical protein